MSSPHHPHHPRKGDEPRLHPAVEPPHAPPSVPHIDQYIWANTNPYHLGSSIKLFLQEAKYFVLFDTNVLCATHEYFSAHSTERIDVVLVHNLNIFYAQLLKVLDDYPNLILIEPIVAEMSNLLRSSQAIAEKRLSEIHGLARDRRESLYPVDESLQTHIQQVRKLQDKIKEKTYRPSGFRADLLEKLVELIKMFDAVLELKKADSRPTADADERLVAAAYYEILVNDRRVAVYSRDDDVRRMTAALFRFVRSTEMTDLGALPLAQKLLVHNLVVHKFDYEKRVYSRYFDASSAEHLERYIFPARILPRARAQFREQANAILGRLGRLILEADPGREPKPVAVTRGDAQEAIRRVSRGSAESAAPLRREAIEDLLAIARHLEAAEAVERLTDRIRRLDRSALEAQLASWREEHRLLGDEIRALSAGDLSNLDVVEALQSRSAEIRDRGEKIGFFDGAISRQIPVVLDDLERARALARRIETACEARVGLTRALVPVDVLAEAVSLSETRVLGICHEFGYRFEADKVAIGLIDLLVFR